MSQPKQRAGRGRIRAILWGALPLLGVLLIGVTPLTATALLIYESAPNGPLATPFVDPSPFGDLPPVIVGDPLAYQSLGVKFYVSEKVKTGSIGGFFAPYPNPTGSDIIGAIIRLEGPSDFPNSIDLTTKDVVGKTTIHISRTAGNYAGDLSKMLSVGWYALVFATDSDLKNDALMPRMVSDIGDPLYFLGTTTTDASLTGGKSSRGCSAASDPRGLHSAKKNKSSRNNCGPDWWNGGFEYLDGSGLGGVRMYR